MSFLYILAGIAVGGAFGQWYSFYGFDKYDSGQWGMTRVVLVGLFILLPACLGAYIALAYLMYWLGVPTS